MKRELEVEPLVGAEMERRALLDVWSWAVFCLDFAKSHFGKVGPVMLGRHWGSLEKVGWKSMKQKRLSPSAFLARTYQLNWQPLGFKARIYDEIKNERASLLFTWNPLAQFIRKYMVGVGTVREADAWDFLLACFEWVKDYGYELRGGKATKGYKITVSRR